MFIQDRSKLSDYVVKCFGTPLEDVEFCVRGMNWGEVEFQGPLLRFMADKKPAFEITLNDVSNVTTGKNEVTLQFHQNDSAPVSMMEMRLHIPAANDGEENTLQVRPLSRQISNTHALWCRTTEMNISFRKQSDKSIRKIKYKRLDI